MRDRTLKPVRRNLILRHVVRKKRVRPSWGRCLLGATLLLAVGCGKREAPVDLPTATAERQNIVVTVDATGTVEPIDLVEVKSKASGQIMKMPVEIGSVVKQGDLLVQIDTRDVQNSYDQAEAALVAAQAKAEVAASQKRRSDDLFAGRVITAVEHESAVLDEANAQADLVRAKTDVELARQRLDDATVRAPISGTILEKPVSVGQVITSATSGVSDGTILLRMADLSRVRLRTLVAETDVGKVRAGQTATVVVDAYPNRPLSGEVEKIEPQAVIQQSVTMFPVLVSISNQEGLLMPGMNGEVTIRVAERDNVLAVPVDALRTAREMAPIAEALGLEMDQRSGNRAGPTGAGTASGDAQAAAGSGEAQAASGEAQAAPASGGQAGDEAGRATRRGDWQERRRRHRPGSGSEAASPGAGSPEGGPGGTPGGATEGAGPAGAGWQGTGGRGAGGWAGGQGGRHGRNGPSYVILRRQNGPEIVPVRTGLSDYDNTEIVSGLSQGDEVYLIGAITLQQQREATLARIRQRMGSGMPGSGGGGRGRR